MIAEFATLVGLLCNYRQEKGQTEALNHQKFIEWLQYHHHEELKNLIVNTAALRTEIDNLLREDQAKMLDKLNQVGDVVMKILGRMDELKSLALAFDPNAQISDQALFILRQFLDSGGRELYYKDYDGGQFFLAVDGQPIQALDPRFIESDIKDLDALKLVDITDVSDGIRCIITRRAAQYISLVASQKLKSPES